MLYTETVVFTSYTSFQVDTQYGTKTKTVFTDTQGREFGVWSSSKKGQSIAATLAASIGQQVSVQFEASQNGEYMNYTIKELPGGLIPGATAAPVAQAPVAQAPVAQAAPVAAPAQPTRQNDDERQVRIMRQKAAGDAIIAFGAAGIDPVVNHAELLEFADEILFDYYVNGRETENVLETSELVTVDAGAEGPVA